MTFRFWILASLLATQSLMAAPLRTVSREELFNHFFRASSTEECKRNTNCKMLRRHLIRDSKSCHMDPTDVESISNFVENTISRPLSVSGTISYLGVAPGKYGYFSYIDDEGTLNIETRIHFSNLNDFSEYQIDSLKSKMARAGENWTYGNRLTDAPVRFKLTLVKDKRYAHISAKLKRDFTRGPYFSRWSLAWGSETITHEMGHMLGLDDEYSNNPFGGSISGCNTSSLMCYSHGGRPMDYHYYLIFRRLLCQ